MRDSGTHWKEDFSSEIEILPSIQSQIAERAYMFYLDAGLPCGQALQHWIAAENEMRRWIDSTINYTEQPSD